MPEPKTRLGGETKVRVCKVSNGLDIFMQEFNSMAAAYSWASKAKWPAPTELKFIEVTTKISIMSFVPNQLAPDEQEVVDRQQALEARLAALAQLTPDELIARNESYGTWY